MDKRKSSKGKSNTLFHPDEIATAISQAIERDFRGAQHVHCLNDSTTLYAFNRQVNELLKKFVPSTVEPETLEKPTYEKFHKVNEHMMDVRKRLKHAFPDPNMRIQSSTSRSDRIHLRARALMHFVLGSFSVGEWFQECKNSGGSSIGVPYVDTSQEAKFTLPMSGTKGAVNLFSQAMIHDSSLREAIDVFNGNRPIQGPWFNEITESRATTVNKNATIKRFISVEGSVNMFLQQGLMLMMYSRMKAVGLDVAALPVLHKTLAKESSISCKNATVDWASASDCGSYELYEWLIPPVWFRYCNETRSTHSFIQGERVELNMFSTMGNAVTFPLETLVFWTYAQAVLLSQDEHRLTLHPEWEQLSKCSVFGDDCIVPTVIAREFIETMEGVGFMINDEKSYYGSEQFRESCGGDYLAGYDVRPFSLKAPQTTKQSALEPWLYIIANALVEKYILYFGELSYMYDKELWRTLFALFRRNKIRVKLVPTYFPDDAGLKITSDVQRFQLNYGVLLNPIAQSKHGTYAFNYLRFVYTKRMRRDDGIRLNLWLRKPVAQTERHIRPGEDLSENDSPIVHDRLERKRGGYVVAKGISCHWHVPTIR